MTTRKALLIACIVPAAVLHAPSSARAATANDKINDQGRLFDSSGNPLTGTHMIQFAIYGAASGGTALWTQTEAQTGTVTCSNGYFQATLDGTTTGGNPWGGIWNGPELYLGITVDSDAEMSPRQEIGYVPYAIYAETANNANNATTAGFAQGVTGALNTKWSGGQSLTLSSTPQLVPSGTVTHTASTNFSNDYIAVWVTATCGVKAGDSYNLQVGFTDNGGAMQLGGDDSQQQNFTANGEDRATSSFLTFGPLTPGDTYVIGPAIATGTAGGWSGTCHGETMTMVLHD
jgi:hypothetical protein